MRYAIYCRKSTDTEDKQVLSLESQEHELLTLANREGFEVITILKESMSAKEPGRPKFNQLLQLIAQGTIDGILCWKIDRLTRNPIDGGQIQWLLQTEKIKCIRTFEKSYYPNDNVLLINIEQAMATQYIRDLSVNVKRGNRAKLERGEWPNHAPLGYVNDKATKTIKIDKKKAPYVIRAFELYATGAYTLQQVTAILYNEGLRTKTGGKVCKNQIHRFLINRFYIGLMERDGKVYQGNHKPLITVSLFNHARDVLEGRNHPRPKKHFYAARGFLTCGACGCMLTADTKKGYQYYYCTNGKGNCQQHKTYLRSGTVDDMVSQILFQLQLSSDDLTLFERAYKEHLQINEIDKEAILKKLNNEAKLLLDKELLLVEGFTSNIIREEVYKAKMEVVRLRHAELNTQIAEITRKQVNDAVTFEQVKTVILNGNKAVEAYKAGSDEGKRKVLEAVLSNINIKDQKILNYQLKSPYNILINAPKNADLYARLALWDDIARSIVANNVNDIIQLD